MIAFFSSVSQQSTITYCHLVFAVNANVVALLGLGASAQQICGDIRHLANLKEMEEPLYVSYAYRKSHSSL